MKKKAILVGYQYEDIQSQEITKLNGCYRDVDLWNELLSRYNFEIEELKGKESGVVLNKFNLLVDELEKGDVGLVFFSCHGYRMFNSLSFNNHSESVVLKKKYFFDYEVNKICREKLNKEARLILIFDSCYSGGMSRGIKFNQGIEGVDYVAKEILLSNNDKWYNNLYEKVFQMIRPLRSLKNVTFINACGMEYRAFERRYENGWNGVFSYHSKKILDRNLNMTYLQFEQKIQESISVESEEQVPYIKTEDKNKTIFS